MHLTLIRLHRRTLAFMLGILAGKWVVLSSWLPPRGFASVNTEEEHEVTPIQQHFSSTEQLLAHAECHRSYSIL